MRHYLRYDKNGELVGCDTRHGGWPDGADPRDAGTQDLAAQRVRKKRGAGQFVSWAAYDCPCPSSERTCLCPHGVLDHHYYNGVVIFPKPQLTVIVDGEPYGGEELRRSPGSTVSLRLVAATTEKHQVLLESVTKDHASLFEGSLALTFVGGQTNTVELIAPPQGVLGAATGRSKYVRKFNVLIRGWA